MSPSGLPGIDYALNPYGGCEHGCIYCYAPGTTHSDPSRWRVVRVKRNIPERLARELPSVEGVIGIGTVTDPYQYAERRFRLTQMCLEILSARRRRVHIHTKSDLILRDVDLLSRMDCRVGITITNIDDRISKMTEPGAPLPGARLDALRGLVDAGIDCYALIAPTMSTLEGFEERLLMAIADTGVVEVYHDPLNLRNVDTTRLDRMGIRPSPSVRLRLSQLGRELGLDVSDDYENRWLDCRHLPWNRVVEQKYFYRRSKLSESSIQEIILCTEAETSPLSCSKRALRGAKTKRHSSTTSPPQRPLPTR